MELGYGCHEDRFMFLPSISVMHLDGENSENYHGYYIEFGFLFLYFFIGILEGEENE